MSFWLVSPRRWGHVLWWWEDIPCGRTVAEGISWCHLLLHLLRRPAGKASLPVIEIRRRGDPYPGGWEVSFLCVCCTQSVVMLLMKVEIPHFLLAQSCAQEATLHSFSVLPFQGSLSHSHTYYSRAVATLQQLKGYMLSSIRPWGAQWLIGAHMALLLRSKKGSRKYPLSTQ